MANRTNPFLERMSERTSDQEFVRLFSPKILERLAEDAFEGAVHIFRSPPGGGKTTLLRAFTPTALRSFWTARHGQDIAESYHRLLARRVLDEHNGPQMLGVLISCASGYADLPPAASTAEAGLFRALLDCRIVLRTLRSLATLLDYSAQTQLDDVELRYGEGASDLKGVPTQGSATELLLWAEQRERSVYAKLDFMVGDTGAEMAPHVRFEGLLWLQSVRFFVNGKEVAPGRMLLIDDMHKLRRKQRQMLIDELTVLRPTIPVWLAERNIALGSALLSQGTREGRDLREYDLEDLWSTGKGQHQFASFAQNILDRRLDAQSEIPPAGFSQYLQGSIQSSDIKVLTAKGVSALRDAVAHYKKRPRYAEWVCRAEKNLEQLGLDALLELFTTRILLARDELKQQMSLDIPLSADELDQRDSSQVRAAAEMFLHAELKIPYYYGIERLCQMGTSNVEELLSLAAALYDGLRAKQALRGAELLLSPQEQERIFRDVAKRKRDFIPKNHTEGTRAQRLLDSIGSYCRERTYLPNAPYAPGVTGVRLSQTQLFRLDSGAFRDVGETFKRVLAECVAENLLVSKQSSASTSRESGTVFYLNRLLCANYDLPLQQGGWQDVTLDELIKWMELGRVPKKLNLLEAP